jgi:hypothetical protein
VFDGEVDVGVRTPRDVGLDRLREVYAMVVGGAIAADTNSDWCNRDAVCPTPM